MSAEKMLFELELAHKDNSELRAENKVLHELLGEYSNRITKLEAEVAHYQEWLKERTEELQDHIRELETDIEHLLRETNS